MAEEGGRVWELDRFGVDVIPIARLVPRVANPEERKRGIGQLSSSRSFERRRDEDILLAEQLGVPHSVVANVLVGAKGERNVLLSGKS